MVVAIYAIVALNAMGGLLGVCRDYLESFCRTTPVDGGDKGTPHVEGESATTATDTSDNDKPPTVKDESTLAATESKKDK
jgi:hypothetical protein